MITFFRCAMEQFYDERNFKRHSFSRQLFWGIQWSNVALQALEKISSAP